MRTAEEIQKEIDTLLQKVDVLRAELISDQYSAINESLQEIAGKIQPGKYIKMYNEDNSYVQAGLVSQVSVNKKVDKWNGHVEVKIPLNITIAAHDDGYVTFNVGGSDSSMYIKTETGDTTLWLWSIISESEFEYYMKLGQSINKSLKMALCVSNPIPEYFPTYIISVIEFIQQELIYIEQVRNKYDNPNDVTAYMNAGRRLDAGKLFLEWITRKYTI